jgi:hypothetical protein
MFQMFVIISFLLVTRTVGITVETLHSAGWQPSNRNMRQGYRTLRPEPISAMRPPPAQESGLRRYPRIPVATSSRHPVIHRPSSYPVISFSQFPSYQEDVKAIRASFAHLQEGYATQKNSPENARQQIAFNQQIVDSTSRKPLKFGDVSDSFLLETTVNKQVTPFSDKQHSQFQSPFLKERHKQQLIGSSTQNPLTLPQNRFVQNKIPSKNALNQNREEYFKRPLLEQNVGHLHTANAPSSLLTVSPASPPVEYKELPLYFRNISTYQNVEPNVQFTQSIEASEHHSTYHAPSNLLDSDPQPSAIRITKAPSFGQATRSLSDNQLTSDIKKKITLNDILVEDCPNAKETGYCASPPRYPS